MGLVERRIRAARGVAASSAATLIALAGHLAAGGPAPPPALVAIPLVLSWLPGVALIGSRLRLWRQTAVILTAQAALHAVFAAGGAAARPTTEPDAMAGMPVGAGAVHIGTTHLVRAVAPTHRSAAMWAGHALAALLTVLAWRRGERAFWALVRLAREAGAAVRVATDPAPAPVAAWGSVAREGGARRPVSRSPGRLHPRRGPPVGAACS